MDRKISVVINTYNADLHLRKVLESLSGFDEVVVCDMESTDDTLSIAREFGCKIVRFPKGDHKICEPARNHAIQSASHGWVTVVDADEVVTPQLREYLYDRISDNKFRSALAIPRRNLFLGKFATGSGDYQLRFFEKSKCDWLSYDSFPSYNRWRIENVPSGRSELYLIHLDDPGLSKRIDKINRYTDYEVEKRVGKRYGTVKMLFRPMWFFIRNYIFNMGFLDGKRGLVRSYFAMLYQIAFMSKIYEQNVNNKKTYKL